MARIPGKEAREAGLLVRLGYLFAKRKVGAVPEPLKITAHHPRLFRAVAHMELGQEAAKQVPAPLKTLASIKVAMLIGCPF